MSDAKAVLPGKTRVVGRIGKVKRIDRQNKPPIFETPVIEKAQDEYSHPKTYPITSDYQLGDEGKIVDIVCNVIVFRNNGFFNISLRPDS